MTREEYVSTYKKYGRLSTTKLEKVVGELYTKKFEEHDISVYEEHRIAARVLLDRSKDGKSLIYHLQNIVVKSC